MCNPVVLKSTDTTHISQCMECNTTFFWHNNIVIHFSHEEFDAFRTIINRSEFDQSAFPFPDEVERIMVRTPNTTINLTFTRTEWEDLKIVLDEAQFVQQVYSLMKT